MSSDWEKFLDDLKVEGIGALKIELLSLLVETKADSEEFIRDQAQKVEQYLDQLAKGEITKEQFCGYMQDIKDLIELQSLKMAVAAKTRAQKLATGIQSMILDQLFRLLP